MGRLDLVISDRIVGDYMIRKEGLRDQITRNKKNFNEGLWGYLAFSRNLSNGKYLAEEYDRVMGDLVREGFYAQIFLNYLNRLPDKLPQKRK